MVLERVRQLGLIWSSTARLAAAPSSRQRCMHTTPAAVYVTGLLGCHAVYETC